MKTTDNFKNAIKSYLDSRAVGDELFAASYAKEGKNLDDCCTYILNWVKKSGCVGFSDDEVFGQAIHYYQEDNIDTGNPISAKVVINRSIELTDEEREEARKKAIAELIEEQKRVISKRPARQAEKATELQQASLF